MIDLNQIHDFFDQCFDLHGETAQGVGWNSPEAQEIRFDQLLKVVQPGKPFTFIEYGCGYGHLLPYMRAQGLSPDHYYGIDILESSLAAAREQFADDPSASFHTALADVPVADYLSASGVFNVKLQHDNASWTRYVINSLDEFFSKTAKGFSVNFLTKYSDYDRMKQRPDLYYADPCFLFDYCKENLSRNVALLHDYEIYDFTLIVRK